LGCDATTLQEPAVVEQPAKKLTQAQAIRDAREKLGNNATNQEIANEVMAQFPDKVWDEKAILSLNSQIATMNKKGKGKGKGTRKQRTAQHRPRATEQESCCNSPSSWKNTENLSLRNF
jgi:hypothetical protein